VLVGLARLPEDLPRRGLALGAATIALLTAAALWFPALRDPVADADPALGWAASLPQLAALAAIALALSRAADLAGDSGPGGWLTTTAVLVGITAALPILVLVGLLLAYSGRAWAQPAAHD